VEGLLGNIIKARALLVKGQGQGGSLANSKKGRGLKAKLPVLFLPPTQNRGGVEARRRRSDLGSPGHDGGRD